MITRMLWIYTIGLCALITFCQEQTVISCRFKGVFHVEENGRYKISRETAEDVCLSLNSTLADYEQIKIAYDVGFETCRYGFIRETIVIPRKTPNSICAANHIGIYNLTTNISNLYDVYCFNASETEEKNCAPVILSNLDILPSFDPSVTETMVPNGASDMVTPTDSGQASYVSFHPTNDEFVQETHDPQYTTDLSMSTEQPDDHSSGDRESQTSHDDTATNLDMGDAEDTLSPLDDLLTQGTTETSFIDGSHGHDGSQGHHATTENCEESEGNDPKDPITASTDSAINEGLYHGNTEDGTSEYDDGSKESGAPKGGRRGNSGQVLLEDPSNATNKPKQRRGSRVPDWLIVVVAVVSLGLILSVCIALNTRRLCGQKRKLVINGKKASVEDGGIIDQNGDTAKSQEMVQLVSHDPPEPSVTMTNEDIRNAKDVDMKIGV